MSEVERSESASAEEDRPAGGGPGVSVSLPSFEGPLDLLLHLCQKHELDILDIPIGFITEKYLEFLAVMQLINLDVASEYLVMAATLAHIKSKMLLPAPPPGQEDDASAEEEDPREALIRRLLEYQKYKLAGEQLQARGVAGRDIFLRGMPIDVAVHTGLPPLAQVPLFALVEAFQNVLTKSKVKLSHDVVHERITLTDRINELVDVLRTRRRVAFDDLFEQVHTRFDLVITFLALLEMTRLRMTRLYQADYESGIYIEFSAQVTSDDGEDIDDQQRASGVDGDRPAAPAAIEEGLAAPQADASSDEHLAFDARGTPSTTDPEPTGRRHRPTTTLPLEEDHAAPEDALEAAPEAALEAAPEAAPEAALEAALEDALEAAPEAALEDALEAAPEAALEPVEPQAEPVAARTRSAFVWLDEPQKKGPAGAEPASEDSSHEEPPSDVKSEPPS